ncbi:hypothetical protein KJ612_08110, partial [Myxococcota bacterium]|nr:hypothetical protein [Myxococcota bacterium]
MIPLDGSARPSRRCPGFTAMLIVAALLSAGNTYDSPPLYPMEAISDDYQTMEVARWAADWVSKPAWSWMEPFFSGRALVGSGGACQNIRRCTGARWGAVGADGKWIVQPVWDRIRMIWDPIGFEVDSGPRKGLLNATGQPWIPVSYQNVELDDNGFALATTADGKGDVFNPDGKRILKGVELSAGAGTDRVWVKRGRRYALYDRVGKQVTPLRYDEFSPSAGPVYPVRVGKTWGLIDGRGKQVAPYAYAGISFLIGRLLTVNVGGTCDAGMMQCTGGRVGVLNLTG